MFLPTTNYKFTEFQNKFFLSILLQKHVVQFYLPCQHNYLYFRNRFDFHTNFQVSIYNDLIAFSIISTLYSILISHFPIYSFQYKSHYTGIQYQFTFLEILESYVNICMHIICFSYSLNTHYAESKYRHIMLLFSVATYPLLHTKRIILAIYYYHLTSHVVYIPIQH
jgi:hypothetical protein